MRPSGERNIKQNVFTYFVNHFRSTTVSYLSTRPDDEICRYKIRLHILTYFRSVEVSYGTLVSIWDLFRLATNLCNFQKFVFHMIACNPYKIILALKVCPWTLWQPAHFINNLPFWKGFAPSSPLKWLLRLSERLTGKMPSLDLGSIIGA